MKINCLLLALLLMSGVRSFACECRISGNVSKYLDASDIVFLGKVVFTDDDGSGTVRQQTLVHFEVEEAFKGLANSVHDVWADPGSFTSCYAEYRLGERYLVFAYRGGKMPIGTAAVSTTAQTAKRKPLPVGIDPENPPTVYYAPECTGTQQIVPQNQKLLASWLKDLEGYKKRQAQ